MEKKKLKTAFNNESYILTAKDPANYENQQVEKYEQIPIDIMLKDQQWFLLMRQNKLL